MTRKVLAVCALAAAVVAAAPASDTEKDVGEMLLSLKGHTILASALRETGVAAQLRGKGPVTLFAPTDAAFRKLGDDELRSLTSNPDRLKALVTAHIVPDRAVPAKDATSILGPAKVT